MIWTTIFWLVIGAAVVLYIVYCLGVWSAERKHERERRAIAEADARKREKAYFDDRLRECERRIMSLFDLEPRRAALLDNIQNRLKAIEPTPTTAKKGGPT